MKNFLLNRRLKRIEQDGNDDLLLIQEFGPRDYPTHELHLLLRQLRRQQQLARRMQHYLFVTGASISIWIAMSFLAVALGYEALSYLFLAMIPFCVLLLVGGHFFMRRRCRPQRDGETIGLIIQNELERRRKDASIF